MTAAITDRRVQEIAADDPAARDLVLQDRVFAVLSPLGTPTAQAAMHQALSRGVLYLFPISASEDAYKPLDPLKFRDEKRYTDRLRDARSKTALQDAVKVAFGQLEGLSPAFAGFPSKLFEGAIFEPED